MLISRNWGKLDMRNSIDLIQLCPLLFEDKFILSVGLDFYLPLSSAALAILVHLSKQSCSISFLSLLLFSATIFVVQGLALERAMSASLTNQ